MAATTDPPKQPPVRVLRPLSAMTEEERQILDAYLSTQSLRKTADRTRRHRNTVAAVVRRYAPALREHIKQQAQRSN